MENDAMIPVSEVCTHYEIEVSFIDELSDSGLIGLIRHNEQSYINEDQIVVLERLIHLRYDLDINVAGIDAISHLLARLDDMQQEITRLRNNLKLYL